ncbi:MAG TPA: radical SAM protein [Gemmataceae bacterium]|nr:radical SAM protein [Gemmataceae bacterium]
MRIAFVNSVARNTAGYHTLSRTFPCLGLQVLAELTPKHHHMDLYDEVLGPSPLAEHLQTGQIDLVALSCYTSGATRAYEIASMARAAGVPVIMGGVHASACPEEAGRYVDSVATGECDDIWTTILEDAERKSLKPIYHGGLGKLEGRGGRAAHWLKPINGRYNMPCIQTSRGCPVGCRFCSVTKFNGPKIRRRDPMEIVDEWNTIPGIVFGSLAFIVDDNFFGVSKKDAEWAKEFCKILAKKGNGRRWFSQTTLNMGDDEEGLRLAYKAGCRIMLIGFESFSPEGLAHYKKGINNKNLARYKELVDKFHKAGIGIIGAFIVGADCDDANTPEFTRIMVNEIGIDVAQMTNLTPLPGTELFDEYVAKGRLVTNNYPEDWERHTFAETIFRPAKMTRYELDHALYQVRSLGLRGRNSVFRKMLRTFWRTKSIETALCARGINSNYRRIIRYFVKRDRERFSVAPQDGGNYPDEAKENVAQDMVLSETGGK